MGKHMGAWWSTHKPTRRRLIQVYAALLYNAHLKGFVQGDIYTGQIKNICVPGFNCYSCPGAIGACPLGALQNALASSGNRAPFYVLGILMLFGLTLGRTICGWLCPLGMIQELLHKLPTPKLQKSPVTRILSGGKYVLLAVFVIAIPLYFSMQHIPMPAFCKYICPAGTVEGAIPLLANPVNAAKFSMLSIFFTRKFVILVLILTACIFIYRAFCRFLCPLGAIYGLFSRLSVLGVKVEATACTHCGLCVARCKMDIQRVGDHECIHCGECIEVCPAKAISMKCGGITLLEKEKHAPGNKAEHSVREKTGKMRGIILWTVALAVLVGVIWFVNRPIQSAKTTSMVQEHSAETEETTGTIGIQETTGIEEVTEAQETNEPQGTTGIKEPTEAQGTGETQGTEGAAQAGSDTAQTGSEVGMRCPDFSVPLYGESGGDFTPYTGKVTIINFWATWCTPCVGELPYFQQLQDTYGEDISMVAIHSNLVTDDVDEFLAREGYTIPFALDETGDVIASLGGSTMLPMTVILDADGNIVYNKVGPVTYELLDSLVAPYIK